MYVYLCAFAFVRSLVHVCVCVYVCVRMFACVHLHTRLQFLAGVPSQAAGADPQSAIGAACADVHLANTRYTRKSAIVVFILLGCVHATSSGL